MIYNHKLSLSILICVFDYSKVITITITITITIYTQVAINPLLGPFMWDMSCLFLSPKAKYVFDIGNMNMNISINVINTIVININIIMIIINNNRCPDLVRDFKQLMSRPTVPRSIQIKIFTSV